MTDAIIITSKGEVKRKPTVRRSLPYQGIARRYSKSKIIYDTEIDISAVINKAITNINS
jgi:hypothetical protein